MAGKPLINLPIDPMLAVPSTGASGRPKYDMHALLATGDWALDTKVDGVRSLWTGERLISRNDEDLTDAFPEVVAKLRRRPDMVLDGEVVAEDGRFETALTRAAQSDGGAIRQLVESMPCRYVAFDLPMLGRSTGGPHPWERRRKRLERLGEIRGLAVTTISRDASLFDLTREHGQEGVIAKRLDSRYIAGKRSTMWVKFKHLHRLSCLMYGYERGEGHRTHFGSAYLHLLDPTGTPVPVGKVGAGWTDRQTHMLKSRLDNKELTVVEIETTHVTSGGTLRFPVFRGVRTDVAVEECSTAQLATIPRC